MLAMISEAPVLGPLIGRAAAFNKKTVVRNADPGAYKGPLLRICLKQKNFKERLTNF